VSERLPVRKTYKLFVGGAFPRSESGRTLEVEGYNVARASRKDAREAVVAARKAVAGWSGATAYNRGQVLYRLAETMETRTDALAAASSGRREVARAIDPSVRMTREIRVEERPPRKYGDRRDVGALLPCDQVGAKGHLADVEFPGRQLPAHCLR